MERTLARQGRNWNLDLINHDLTERLVAASDFSQGKASKIFNDVVENDKEYIASKIYNKYGDKIFDDIFGEFLS